MAVIGIIGAGVAGLSCAERLVANGHHVALLDKGRRPAGRMASRVFSSEQGVFAFDYGAQYFTVRDDRFRAVVKTWEAAGLVARWPVAGDDAWVGMPEMSSPLAAMAEALDVEWSHHVVSLHRRGALWYARHQHGETGPFDAIVLALPAEQAAALSGVHDFALAQLAVREGSQPCWSAMIGFAEPLHGVPDMLSVEPPLAWAARNVAKAGRPGGEAWVLHADADWSRVHLEDEPEDAAVAMLGAFRELTGHVAEPVFLRAHRWRFAMSARSDRVAYHNAAIKLGACGDWLIAPRVESAWLSGHVLAETLNDAFAPSRVEA